MSKWMENSPALERLIQKKSVTECELRQLRKDIETIARNNIEDIIPRLDLPLHKSGSVYRCACPVHGGDNPSGFSIGIGEYAGVWTCWTHHCEHGRGGMVNLIKILYDFSLEDSLRFILDSTKNRNIERKEVKVEDYQHNETRLEIRQSLSIPSKYYLERGINSTVLDMYDVGYCSSGPMKDRVVFPIYDISGKYIGCTGRTMNLPPKWKHHEIKTGNHLYNINWAAPHINKQRSVVLVESTGNVLKLVQNGIKNCLGTFGAKLSDQQIIKLECLDIVNVHILFDNDEAGKLAAQKAKDKLKQFNVDILEIEENDVFDMSDEKVKELGKLCL